jgi:hypothetical protein
MLALEALEVAECTESLPSDDFVDLGLDDRGVKKLALLKATCFTDSNTAASSGDFKYSPMES